MNRKAISLIATVLGLVLIFFLYTSSIRTLPPVGSFFHPIEGFWANAETVSPTGRLTLSADELIEPVEVFFDERGVPHIFAQNDYDLYFAQGFVTARDRLFQMEIQIRAAGGMLSEWMGERTLEYDRHQRRLGMVYGAERAMEMMQSDENPEVFNAIQAYSDGVNAYISTLDYASYPVEYKILNVKPADWEPNNSALILKYMTQRLAGYSTDISTSNTLAYFGEDFVNRFLSTPAALLDPIVPPGTDWDFRPLQADKPEMIFEPGFASEIQKWQPDPHNGSNTWVVSGEKTAGGYPILSNDMHLNMTAPAIWYENQLKTPDSNVYGVSLPGTPTVIVGFNEHIAWGSTNTGADVMDWIEITFRDDTHSEYLYDGDWLPVLERIETIHVKGGEPVTERILFTHHGPVYTTAPGESDIPEFRKNLALQWIAHEPSNEMLTFYRFNRAKSVDDFREAFRTFRSPAQNMSVADIHGNIAIQTGGQFPLKWQFQGRTVGDGADPRHDWTEYVPYEHNPFSLNPERGYLSAANQDPADLTYPYYLGDDFAPYERGRRINDLLEEMNDITVEDFQDMLMDNFSYHAYTLLPVLIERMDRSVLNPLELRMLSKLESWNYENVGEWIEPSLFRAWWVELYQKIWGNKYDTDFPMRWPNRDKTVELIRTEPESPWFNNWQTDDTETLNDLIRASYSKAMEELETRLGDNPDNWQWGYYNNTNLNHIGNIPGMGVMNLFTDGGSESINAIFGSHGPSARLVFELDPNGVRGYGVYPGGQSGNPGSKSYDRFVEAWLTGELYEFIFLKEKPDPNDDRFPLMIQLE